MIKKNIYTIILAALLAMSFAGCASQNKATESNTEAISADQSNTESKTASSGTDQSNTESKTASSGTDQSNTESKTASSGTDQSNTESKTASSSNTNQSNTESKTVSSSSTNKSNTQSNTVSSSSTNQFNAQTVDSAVGKLHNLELHFGPNGPGYTINLDNNNTAAEIARYVGQEDWNLPIYHFDDFDNYNVMQYYDIPSRYKINSVPEKITSEKAGDVYYSAPNRIVLFYQDAKVTGDFTKVGHLQSTDGLDAAVKNNPVVEGWGNKIIKISPVK